MIRGVAGTVGVDVLVLRVTDKGTYSWLICTNGGLATKHFSDVDLGTLNKFLLGSDEEEPSGWLSSYGNSKDPNQPGGFHEWQQAMTRQLGDLWNLLISEINEFVSHHVPPGTDSRLPPSLVIVPDQILGVLPLHASWRHVEGKKRYWCDDYVLSYAPSLASLTVSAEVSKEPHAEGMFAVANPTGDLPWAGTEVASIARRFSSEERTIFGDTSGLLPTEKSDPAEVLRSLGNRYGTMVFSCHGTWNATDPWRLAGFKLQSAGEDHPAIALKDLAGLDCRGCKLVLLSACETGLTNALDPTREYVGLPAAFLATGAATAVGTLWSVEDVSTALIISHAFGSIQPRASSTKTAVQLHKAQRWIREASFEELEKAIGNLPASNSAKTMAVHQFRSRGRYPCSHPTWWAAFACFGKP